MKILNLVDLAKSDIKYKISKFPDGQQNITIIGIEASFGGGLKRGYILDFVGVIIQSRLNNFKDLELITATVACLRNLGVEKIHLYTPYIVGARSDRQFEKGGNHYLKQVICPILNSLKLDGITCIDPHSNVLEALLDKFTKSDNKELVKFAINSIYPKEASYGFGSGSTPNYPFMLVSPDAGASHKIYKLAEAIGYKGDIITCSKERDTEGKLTQTIVPNLDKITDQDLIIIDDICDGGRTFINIVKYIEETDQSLIKNKKYLIVTHGIFSAGFSELNKYFDGIYCTNSYSNIGDKVMINGELQTTNVKQLNVL